MTQVAGRAGRRVKQGKVLIQVSRSDNPVFNEVKFQKYDQFFDREIRERADFNYPPFIKMIHLQLKHKDAIYLDNAAKMYENRLRTHLGNGVSVPITPSVSRVKNMYLKDLIIKIKSDTKIIAKTKYIILKEKENLFLIDNVKGLRINIDVDPI
jgi:primosomal protein N' (replication factor Y)